MRLQPTDEYEIIDTYKDYKYAVWFNDVLGYRCGYVKIPENHPFYEQPFMDIDIDSIELTFSGRLKGLDGWFIGWDHHHIWDGIDEEGIKKAHSDLPKKELYELLEYARSMSGANYSYYETITYANGIEEECHMVIDEIISKT